jgi:hypothetical protein
MVLPYYLQGVCQTDLKKFAALNAVRVRILFVEKVIGKGWTGGQEPQPSHWNPAETFNYHRDLWKWILDGAKDDRAVTLKNHVQQAGLKQPQFCESIANTVISTSFIFLHRYFFYISTPHPMREIRSFSKSCVSLYERYFL